MKLASLACTTAALVLLSAPAMGATAAAGKPAAGPASREQVQHAELYLKVLIGGLQSDKVPEPVKGALVGCIYTNSLSKISDSMDKVIAANPSKIHRDKPNELLEAMAAICGYRSAAAAPAAPSGGTAAAGR